MTHAGPAFSAIATAAVLSASAVLCSAAKWKPPKVSLRPRAAHPVVACTPAELGRLRAAYKAKGGERAIVARVVSRADAALRRTVTFPPRGGQHNQWYQCDKCQLALKTIDATHHRCPRCKKVYSGEPYDDVIFSRVHSRNLRDAADCAWAYAVTGEAKYAARAAEVLLGYAERYAKYPYHSASRSLSGWGRRSGGHLFEQTLNEASAMARTIAPAYDLICDSPALKAADRQAIRAGLLMPMLANIDKNKAGKSNWQTWHNAGMLWGGAALGEADWVRKAIAQPGNGFVHQMNVSVTPEGMWYENSWGYHFYTLAAMVKIVEGARRLGIDLWSHPGLKRMFTVAVDYAMPDGSLPRFGDDVHTTIAHAARYLEYAYHAYADESMAAWLTSRPTWESVLLGRETGRAKARPHPASKVFPGAGHAILRADGPGGLAAALTFGPYGGFHGHYDKLSFVFFGHRRELGVDPGRARSQAYRLPIHRHWYKATLGHNAVLVDCAPQKPAAGRLVRFASNSSCAAVAAECDKAYPGVRHRRLLCMTPTYLLVYDDLSSSGEKSRRFDWVYHNRGSAVHCEAADRSGKLGTRYPGQEYVRNVKTGAVAADAGVHARIVGEGVTTHVLAAPGRKTEVRIGDGVGESILDRVPMVMLTRHGRGVRFAVVLEPVVKARRHAVRDVRLDASDGGARITVRRARAEDVIDLDAQGEIRVTAGRTPAGPTDRNRAP